jgi:hypothetical protein
MAETAPAKVGIVNRALLKLGLPASYSIDANTSIGGIVDTLWPGVEARAVAVYDWSHFRATRQASVIAAAPANGWAYGFTLPADRVGDPIAVLDQAGANESYLRSFMLEAGNLYTNVKPVWVRVRVMQDPNYWDLGFQEAFVVALAAELAVPLTQDENARAQFMADAWGKPQENGLGGLMGRLIALNRAAQPQGRRFMDNDPLTAARFS